MAACVAWTMVRKSRPLMMISWIDTTLSGTRDCVPSFCEMRAKLGERTGNAELVSAARLRAARGHAARKREYYTRHRSSGNAARSAASKAPSGLDPMNQRLPPIRPSR